MSYWYHIFTELDMYSIFVNLCVAAVILAMAKSERYIMKSRIDEIQDSLNALYNKTNVINSRIVSIENCIMDSTIVTPPSSPEGW